MNTIINGYTVQILICLFFIYSFIGFISDTLFTKLDTKKWMYRGFLFAPICPIYGTGALIVLMVLPRNLDYFSLYFLGMILATSLEFITSYVLEKIFHTIWWDYSDKKFNLQGRICLMIALGWGALIVVVIKFLNPAIVDILGKLDKGFIKVIIPIFLTLLVIDTTLSIIKAAKVKHYKDDHNSEKRHYNLLNKEYWEDKKRLLLRKKKKNN